MPKVKASTIDDYLSGKPESVQAVLQEVRRAIGRAIPAAAESISYQIPAYRLGTTPVVFFAGWTEHYSLYPARATLVAAFAKELEPYSISKGTIRFPLTEKVPARLIARLAKFLFQEASAAAELKRARTAAKKAAPKKAASKKAASNKAPRKITRKAAPAAHGKTSARALAKPTAKLRSSAKARRVRAS